MSFPSLKRPGPKSNRQRQREFRERNPHYYRDLHRKRKAEVQAFGKLRADHPELTAGQACAIVKGTAPHPPQADTKAPAPVPVIKQPLLLPAVAQSHRTTAVNLPQPVILIKTPTPGMAPGTSPGTSPGMSPPAAQGRSNREAAKGAKEGS